MSAFEICDEEDDPPFQRRRDLHHANFLMCERNPDEDDHSCRQRLNDMTDSFREKWRAAGSDPLRDREQVMRSMRQPRAPEP